MAELFADNNIDLFTSFVRWLYGQAHLFFYKCNLSIVIDTSSNNAHCLNSWNYLHKSGDNRVTWYCRTQKISQMWFFGFEKLPRLLAVRSKYPSERKNLTQQLNHYRWLESQVFVTRLPLQLCQKWSDFGCVKAKMTYFTLLSMQRLRQHNK